MKLILQAIKSMFRGVYNAIEASKTHWDTRKTLSAEYAFDGNLEGKEIVALEDGFCLVKVADDFPEISSITDLKATYSSPSGSWDDETEIIPSDAMGKVADGIYFVVGQDVVYVSKDAEFEGIHFTKGLYFFYTTTDDFYVSKLSVTYSVGELKKLDKKYLPDNVATIEQVEEVQETANNAQTTADSAQTTANNAQTAAETAQTTADKKMDKSNPVCTGSFSMNRRGNAGSYSSVHGRNNVASADYSHAGGLLTIASAYAQNVSGTYNIAEDLFISKTLSYYGYYEKVLIPKNSTLYLSKEYSFDGNTGQYSLINPIAVQAEDFVNSGTQYNGYYIPMSIDDNNKFYGTCVNDVTSYDSILYLGYRSMEKISYNNYNFSISINTSEEGELVLTRTSSKIERGRYVCIVGNGASESARSNAHTLDWEGNAWYAGDVYVGSTSGTNRDEGSKKLATEEKVTELAIKNPEEASVGQTIVVKSVDENGKPTEWEAVDLPGGGGGNISVDTILPFTENEISGVASGGGFVVNPTNFADGKTYFRYNAGATYGFRWTNPNPQKGSLTITMRGYSQYSTTMTTGVFVVYMDGTESRILLTHGETVTYTTDPDKTVDYIRGNYDFENWVLLDMDALSIVADYPAPAGTVKSVNGILPDENGNVEIPVSDDSVTSIFLNKTASFYGDSLTEVNRHYTKGYHQWVKEILGLASYKNYGVSGYKVSDVYNKVNSVTDTADIIFVMIGVNDVQFDVPLGAFGELVSGTVYGNLNLLCARLREKYPTKLLVFITPHEQTNYPSSIGVSMYDVAKAVKEVCGKYSIVVYDNFVKSEICTTNLSYWTTDNCHWNDKAHEMVGKNLAHFVTNTFRYIPDTAVEPEKTLNSITATFNQGDAVIYDTDTLDSLKQYLTVTASYSDGSTATVTGYTLSGTLAEGTSTITASYGGKNATFTVEVTKNSETGGGDTETDNSEYIGKTFKMNGYHNNIFNFAALVEVDSDFATGNTVELNLAGSNAVNMNSQTAVNAQLFGDESGKCGNSSFNGTFSDGKQITSTVDDNGNVTVDLDYVFKSNPTTKYLKVVAFFGAVSTVNPSYFTIEHISVIVNGKEKEILAIGGFFSDEPSELLDAPPGAGSETSEFPLM